jgi:hypothetical protein
MENWYYKAKDAIPAIYHLRSTCLRTSSSQLQGLITFSKIAGFSCSKLHLACQANL